MTEEIPRFTVTLSADDDPTVSARLSAEELRLIRRILMSNHPVVLPNEEEAMLGHILFVLDCFV